LSIIVTTSYTFKNKMTLFRFFIEKKKFPAKNKQYFYYPFILFFYEKLIHENKVHIFKLITMNVYILSQYIDTHEKYT